MGFRLVRKSVTLNDLERRNGVISANSGSFRAHCVNTFAISSPDEFLSVVVTIALKYAVFELMNVYSFKGIGRRDGWTAASLKATLTLVARKNVSEMIYFVSSWT